MRIQYSEGINFNWLNGWQYYTLASQNFRVEGSLTRDLRKGGPIEMLTTCTIAKLINFASKIYK